MVLSRKKFPWVNRREVYGEYIRVVRFGEWPITHEGSEYKLEGVYATPRGKVVLELLDPDGERVYATEFRLDDYGQEVTNCRKTKPPHLRPIWMMRSRWGEEPVGLHKIHPVNGRAMLVDAAIPQDNSALEGQRLIYYYFQREGDERTSKSMRTRKFDERFGIGGRPAESNGEVDWGAVDKLLKDARAK